jgi:protein SCO1/2
MPRIFLALVMFLSVCSQSRAQMKAASDVGIDEKLGALVAMDAILRDESGKEVTLRDYVDKPTILIFNYFRCPGICPVLLSSVVEVINKIQLEPGKDFRLVAVSFDPTDTPAMAREKKANYLNQLRRRFPPDAWHFLTGTAENTRVVADSTGYEYRPQGDMYVHPGAIIILTPKGIISRYLYGTSFLPSDVEMAIDEAGRGEVRPTISKMLAFCYAYDPEGRQYVFSITRLMGTFTLILVAVFIVFVLRGRSKRKQPN